MIEPPLPVEAPKAFASEVERLLSEPGGRRLAVRGYRGLSHRRSQVGRVELEDDSGETSTRIVKHVPFDEFPSRWPEADIELREERLAYHFLEKTGAFTRRPRLLAESPAGILVLSDLGDQERVPQRTFDELIPRLAGSLAALHAGCRPHLETYRKMRLEHHLGSPADDRRDRGGPRRCERFATGVRCLSIMDPHLLAVPAVSRDLDDVLAGIRDPGPFETFIHDDLANYRQTAEADGVFCFLDFEQAKLGHALLDLTKPMIGKFEVMLDSGQYLWSNPSFPMALAESYREILDRQHGLRFPDEEWQEGLSRALLFAAMTLVGKVLETWGEPGEGERRLVGMILSRLLELIGGIRRHADSLAIFERLAADAMSGASPGFPASR